MNSNNQTSTNPTSVMAWYKVPIMWLMMALLGFTVISGVYLFWLAHDTNDSIVTDNNYRPLDKKTALPNTSKNTIKIDTN